MIQRHQPPAPQRRRATQTAHRSTKLLDDRLSRRRSPAHGHDIAAIARRQLDCALDSLDQHLARLAAAADSTSRRTEFRAARRQYKRVEGLLSYYAPQVVSSLNSNEVQRLDEDQSAGAHVPRGFQRLEPWLFPSMNDSAWSTASREIALMRSAATHFRPTIAYLSPSVDVAFEIARLELARVATLGIAGFDSDASGDAVRESADAIDGLAPLLPDERAAGALRRGAAYARAHADFDRFDRFVFVRDYVNPAFDSIARARPAQVGGPLVRTWPRSVASGSSNPRCRARGLARARPVTFPSERSPMGVVLPRH